MSTKKTTFTDMKINFLLKTFTLGFLILFIVSCDKDFNEIGVSVVGDDHYGFVKYDGASVIAYNQATGVVQTNNLPINAIGVLNNDVLGKTTSSFVTQVQLSTVNPKFYEPVMNLTSNLADSVYLYVPYYSALRTDGSETYKLDSIYGGNSKIKLKLYESNRYIQTLDPNDNLQSTLKYYSDQSPDFNSSISSVQLNDGVAAQNDDFSFSPSIINIKRTDGTVIRRLTPGIYMDLNKSFFFNKILNAPTGSLLNNNIFKNYFRGLYFKAESHATEAGAMAMLNFSAGIITIVYRDYANATDFAAGDPSKKVRKTLQLKLTGNTVNLHENDYSATNGLYLAALNNPLANPSGDERLFVKGQHGSLAVIELFGSTDVKGIDQATGQLNDVPNGISDELDEIRVDKWLINEANLTFYIDNELGSPTKAPTNEPIRLYLYDLNNNQPVIDYNFDVSRSPTSSKFDKSSFGGIIQKEEVVVGEQKRGTKYKVRLTHHMRSLVKNLDSTNVRLGLAVTEDITRPQNYFLKNPFVIGTNTSKFMPFMSIVNPLGTVLYGTNSNLPVEKRLKLEIYYTKPD
jgi:hypothetical protein